jgi:hypothetical protein
MRTRTIATLALAALSAAACGSSAKFADRPRPATPVQLTVYINDTRVSVSPSSVGAGPVQFTITNQASSAESLEILAPGPSGQQPLAQTGPINPQGTAQIAFDFESQGTYTVATGPKGSAEASLAAPSAIQPAALHIGVARAKSSGQLLSP